LIALGERLAEVAAKNAPHHDRDNTFPFDTFQALRDAGYLALTVPEEYGGKNVSPLELMLAQERLATGDGAVALGVTMHLAQVVALARGDIWPADLRDRLLEEVVADGTLFNNLASEPELGSPSRGGAYRTLAVRDGDEWVINGRKTWSTLSPGLTHATVLLAVQEEDGSLVRGTFFVPMATQGVRIEKTWDSLSMRATGSHDVVFEDVRVPDEYRLIQRPGLPAANPGGWGLITSAVYLGVATAARNYAIRYAQERRPSALNGETISSLQTVQHRVARMELLLLQARSVLYGAAELWDKHPEWHDELAPQLAAAKYTVTNNGIEITDQALRLTGSSGLNKQHPLERYFRDIRAGLGNPPLDDVALTLIGKAALDLS
jgi:alkylation response protein AidB-like acyl-CoA dehydrogenase